MLGNTQDVLNAVRQNLQPQIDLSTAHFSEPQRKLTNALVGASMADLTWRSNTDPNEEKRWELPRVALDVVEIVVNSATMAAHRVQTEDDFAAFMAGPKLRQIAAETKIEVHNTMERRARGRY